MTILKKGTPFVLDLQTKLAVLSVEWDPHAESRWWLQYQNFPKFLAYDKMFETKAKDEQLVGQEIEGQIFVSADENRIIRKRKKTFSYKDGWVEATGVIEDDIKSYSKNKYNGIHKEFINYKLNSIFPIEISSIPKKAKIGDWITIRGEAEILFPKKRKK